MSGTLHSSTTVGMEGRQTTTPVKESCDQQAKCLKRIQSILDGGATDEEKQYFKDHIEACQPCIDMYHLEKCIKEALQGKVEKKCCPEKIAAAIRSEIIK